MPSIRTSFWSIDPPLGLVFGFGPGAVSLGIKFFGGEGGLIYTPFR